MKLIQKFTIQSWLHEFATNNLTLDSLKDILHRLDYNLDAIKFIKKFEVEILVTSYKTNKTYKIQN